MTVTDIISAAQSNAPRFRRWLVWALSWEVEADKHGNIKVEELGDGAGKTFAGLTSRDDGLTDNPSPHWVVATYRSKYWLPCNADTLPSPVGEVVTNYALNCGVKRAGIFLQKALVDYGKSVAIDGVVGPATALAAYSLPNSKELALAVIAKSQTYYNQIAFDGRQQWLRGWINRNASLRDTFCV
jgi:Predicted Peptidoglycan domain